MLGLYKFKLHDNKLADANVWWHSSISSPGKWMCKSSQETSSSERNFEILEVWSPLKGETLFVNTSPARACQQTVEVGDVLLRDLWWRWWPCCRLGFRDLFWCFWPLGVSSSSGDVRSVTCAQRPVDWTQPRSCIQVDLPSIRATHSLSAHRSNCEKPAGACEPCWQTREPCRQKGRQLCKEKVTWRIWIDDDGAPAGDLTPEHQQYTRKCQCQIKSYTGRINTSNWW